MKEVSIEELKKVQLDILNKVASFCDKNNIKYWLDSGTLLGAIRHSGYIPWDDDVDIGMLRDDYNRFLDLFNKSNTRYKAYSIENNDKFLYPYCKVLDTNTILIESGNELSINIDVFVYDNAPKNPSKTMRLLKRRDFYRKCQMIKTRYTNNKTIFEKIIIYLLSILLIPFPKNFFIKRIANVGKKYQNIDSGYVAVFPSYELLYFNKEWFMNTADAVFENKKYKMPVDYDDILKTYYGDYMKLPKEEDRVTHHEFKAYYKD